jgi:hypothetical protein
VPRPERVISEENPVAELALELRRLRASAGNPSYRALAAQANFSFSTLAKAANGQDLPTLDVALALAAACGGDRGDIRARWETAQRSLNREAAGRRNVPAVRFPACGSLYAARATPGRHHPGVHRHDAATPAMGRTDAARAGEALARDTQPQHGV